jgi:hypothetical protein
MCAISPAKLTLRSSLPLFNDKGGKLCLTGACGAQLMIERGERESLYLRAQLFQADFETWKGTNHGS